jgi:hypothetical protein
MSDPCAGPTAGRPCPLAEAIPELALHDEAGASYGLLARVVGLSRQRVARIVAED